MRLKREATPPGPVTTLFDALHALHLEVGEPSVRDIAAGISRIDPKGRISHATVYALFRGPKVPRWRYLFLVVQHLGGDTERFRELWKATREPVPTGERLLDLHPGVAEYEQLQRRYEALRQRYDELKQDNIALGAIYRHSAGTSWPIAAAGAGWRAAHDLLESIKTHAAGPALPRRQPMAVGLLIPASPWRAGIALPIMRTPHRIAQTLKELRRRPDAGSRNVPIFAEMEPHWIPRSTRAHAGPGTA